VEAQQQDWAQCRRALRPLEVADWQAQYQAVLLQGEVAQPRELSPPPQAKGRRKQSASSFLFPALNPMNPIPSNPQARRIVTCLRIYKRGIRAKEKRAIG
jgi:hypothetical protein